MNSLNNLAGKQRVAVIALSVVSLSVAVLGLIRWYKGKSIDREKSPTKKGQSNHRKEVTSRLSTRHRYSPSLSSQNHNFERIVLGDNVVGSITDCLGDIINRTQRYIDNYVVRKGQTTDVNNMKQKLEQLKQIQHELQDFFDSDHIDRLSRASSSTTMTYNKDHFELPYATSIRRTVSVLSDDSYKSAFEDLIPESGQDIAPIYREALNLPTATLRILQEGFDNVARAEVPYRAMRTELTHCANDEEFLAKLYCVRSALAKITNDEEKRNWMILTGRRLIAGLLEQAAKETAPFYEVYDHMIDFISQPGVWPQIYDELKQRHVQCINFYDIVLDFILLDAFDDLANPPSAVFAVTRNSWLSSSVKEATLRTVITSVIKGKRSRLVTRNGFIARFYDISEKVSPILGWGFLGCNDHLRELCYYFKEQINLLMIDMFSQQRVRYTNLHDLSEDIWLYFRTRAEAIDLRLNGELVPAEI